MSAIAGHAITFFFLWLFASAGIHKVSSANLDYYIKVFASYGMPGKWVNAQVVKCVGSVEIATGVLIVLPATRWMGASLAACLLSAYLLAMARQLWQGQLNMDCGCSGPSGADTSISHHLLIRNVVLVIMALLCLLPLSDAGIYQALPLAALLLVVGLALLMVLLYLSAEQLISSGQKLQRLKRS
ncbi:MauE/DoxX family redox-associated membrane protein [Granulosicoccus antarcticus]|nr:MauE/DoxX family redox-associated membrane protein [Granulosicoccus antarcticus]